MKHLSWLPLLLVLSGCTTTRLDRIVTIVEVDNCPGVATAYLSVGCVVSYLKPAKERCINCLDTYYFACAPSAAARIYETLDVPPNIHEFGSADLCLYRVWKVRQ